MLDGTASDYRFTKGSNKVVDGLDDAAEFKTLKVILILIAGRTIYIEIF